MNRVIFATIILTVPCFRQASAAPDDWELRKQSSNSWCNVQKKAEDPHWGSVIGRYATVLAACQGAKSLYDSSSSDQSKCWTYLPQAISRCNAVGVDLPK